MVTCTLFDTLTARCGRQVTHTDLKPENMLIGCDNQIKLCDFGMGQRAAAGTMWAVTGELSTLWYRAPELLLGCKTFGEKIDEWAVGCIGMEMLCGTTIFQGNGQGTCKCPPVTHRNFNSDQVGKVLQVAGSPKSLAGFECAGHVKDWPTYPRKIEQVVKQYCQVRRMPEEHPDENGNVSKSYHSSTLWAQAIGSLLTILPDERLTCRKVLAMPLFQHASTFVVQPDLRGGTTSSAGSVSASFDFRQQPKTPANSSTRQALQHAYSQNSNMQGCG